MSQPSIFNDVIGPVMRGPSSSHSAASLRIGRLCRDLMGGDIKRVEIVFDPNGSLATTHDGQGSDMGLMGGFLGWEAHDERLLDYRQAIEAAGIEVKIDIRDIGATHPNTYLINLHNDSETHSLVALSVGGGMIEVIEIDGAIVSMEGDYYETLIYTQQSQSLIARFSEPLPNGQAMVGEGDQPFVLIKTNRPLTEQQIEQLGDKNSIDAIKVLAPVLPVMSRPDVAVPFTNCAGMLAYNRERNLPLWQLAVHYEAARGDLTEQQVWEKMSRIVQVMQGAIERGLQGTEYDDRILPCQSLQFKQQMEKQNLLQGDLLNTIILYVTAIMEVKSAMGVIVAAPTAGSCGTLPGAVLGASRVLGSSEKETIHAMLAASIIGLFIAHDATFAAEVGGCQAECGSGAGMAAAGIVHLAGGSLDQSLVAASLALQNSFGMVCDPIANRVEAPCLGKNIMAASNAVSCANMGLAGYDPLIPLDEVIHAMGEVGQAIPSDLRCTGKGGLSTTPAAQQIEQRLSQQGVAETPTGKRFKMC